MRKIFLIMLFVVMGSLVLVTDNYAEDETGDDIQGEIQLRVGQIKIIPVNGPKRIAIGNPDVADVEEVTSSEITISPKASGVTSLVFWDNSGEQSYKLRVFSQDMDEIKRRVDSLMKNLNLPEAYTKIAQDEEKVLLLGTVKTSNDRERVNVVLGDLKDKTVDLIEVKEEESVVEIDVQVLELDKDATNSLGLTNPLSSSSGITLTEVHSPGLGGAKWSELFKVLDLQRSAFTWTLYALIQEGKARILSRPRLACQSGKEAELLVGGEKPTFTTQVAWGGGTGTTVEYKEFGIKLNIKPTVTEKERIKLGLLVEVSEVGTAEFIGSSANRTAQAYPLTKRTASTELYLNNGQTMAIGGLMKQKVEEDVTKSPGLSDIPIFGALFRRKLTKRGGGYGERGDTELFITLTPKIVGSEIEKDDLNTQLSKRQIEAKAAPLRSAVKVNLSDPISVYARVIQSRILESIIYPSLAKKAGFEGTVRLSLHLSYSGELLDAKVKESSGYTVIDDSALAAARNTPSYPPFPSAIEQKELWIDVPITYQLN